MDIKWHESVSTAAKNLITSDSHIVRVWNPKTVSGTFFLSFLYLYSIEQVLHPCCFHSQEQVEGCPV